MEITKNTNLGELSRNYPEIAELLQKDYGLHCVGCFANVHDTLETGLRLHGYQEADINAVIEEINRTHATS